MKKSHILFLTILFLLAAAVLATGPVLKFQGQEKIAERIPGSRVNIMECSVDFLGKGIHCSDIEIQKPEAFQLTIPQLDIEFTWTELLQRQIKKITATNPHFVIKIPQQDLKTLSSFLKGSPGPSPNWTFDQLQMDELDLSILAKNLKFNGLISFNVDIQKGLFKTLSYNITELQTPVLSVQNATLAAIHSMNTGEMAIESLELNKLKMTEIKSSVRLDDNHKLFCDGLTAKFLNGSLIGKITLEMSRLFDYRITIDLTNLDTARLVNDLKLNQKFTLSGLLKGHLGIQVRGTHVRELNGSLDFGVEGGTLKIYDTTFLENLAQQYQQSLEGIQESFKNYEFTTGTTTLSLDQEQNIVITLQLNGKNGKREFTVYLHDYLTKDGI